MHLTWSFPQNYHLYIDGGFIHHYEIFPPGWNVTGGNFLGGHDDYDDANYVDDDDDDEVDDNHGRDSGEAVTRDLHACSFPFWPTTSYVSMSCLWGRIIHAVFRSSSSYVMLNKRMHQMEWLLDLLPECRWSWKFALSGFPWKFRLPWKNYTSYWGVLWALFDFVLRALQALRPCGTSKCIR